MHATNIFGLTPLVNAIFFCVCCVCCRLRRHWTSYVPHLPTGGPLQKYDLVSSSCVVVSCPSEVVVGNSISGESLPAGSLVSSFNSLAVRFGVCCRPGRRCAAVGGQPQRRLRARRHGTAVVASTHCRQRSSPASRTGVAQCVHARFGRRPAHCSA